MREFQCLPAILTMEEVIDILRLSRSSAYKLFKCVGSWKDEDYGKVILKSDLVAWIKANTFKGY